MFSKPLAQAHGFSRWNPGHCKFWQCHALETPLQSSRSSSSHKAWENAGKPTNGTWTKCIAKKQIYVSLCIVNIISKHHPKHLWALTAATALSLSVRQLVKAGIALVTLPRWQNIFIAQGQQNNVLEASKYINNEKTTQKHLLGDLGSAGSFKLESFRTQIAQDSGHMHSISVPAVARAIWKRLHLRTHRKCFPSPVSSVLVAFSLWMSSLPWGSGWARLAGHIHQRLAAMNTWKNLNEENGSKKTCCVQLL